jgi:two-component system response regulator BaeR
MSAAPLIQIADDDEKIAAVLVDYLRAAGYEVAVVGDGQAAVDFAREGAPACILLDLNLPVLEGLEACKAIRRFSDVPIAMVTARVDEIDRLLGLELGADDYICKPFSPREVVSRVKALLRRARPAPATAASSPIEIDAERMRVRLKGKPVALTAVEFRLLATLAERPGRIYSRDQLLDAAHPEWRDVGDRSVDSHIRNLRKKLAAAEPGFDCIRSVYGVGYAFEIAPASTMPP